MVSRYKWRGTENLTLKRKFEGKNKSYTCTHDDFPRNKPCEHPSHYEGVSIYFLRTEIETLDALTAGLNAPYSPEIRSKIASALQETEYPYEEGF
jgi:hypothetical protein